MTFLNNALIDIENYSKKYNEEINPILKKQIRDKQNLNNRKNFGGHITSSCYLLSKNNSKILFILNKNLNLLLQPGGHCEIFDSSPINVAFREILEETNISKNAFVVLDIIPIEINSHEIKENKKKNEPIHFHHDFRYLLKLKKMSRLKFKKKK